MRPTLGIIGAGGHAKVVADAIKRQGDYLIHGFYDDNPDMHGKPFYAESIIWGDRARLLKDLENGTVDRAFVAVGHNAARCTLGRQILDAGFPLATIIDPTAILSPSVRIGVGTLIVAGAIVNADTRIGDHAIVNTGASIDHDCVIEDGVHIAPHATLCGGVRVGAESLIGAGATLIPGVSFPPNSVLGAGGTVVKSLDLAGTYCGTPCHLHST